mgnify:CR=1 FL=1
MGRFQNISEPLLLYKGRKMRRVQLSGSYEKKKHKVKSEGYVSLKGHTEDLSPGGSLSDNSEILFQRGKGGARIYRHLDNKH